MDLREIEKIVKEKKGGIIEKKEILISILSTPSDDVDEHGKPTTSSPASIDSGSALQLFLDHIPISSIHISNSASVLKFRTQDSLIHAIRAMYDNNISAAPVIDNIKFDPDIINHSDQYVGIIDFASMVLWFLEECDDYLKNKKDDNLGHEITSGMLSMLEHVHHIAETKIGELAKSYLWEPFFPINLNDTLFHVLLLLSKHQLHIVPIIEGHKSNITGFLTESAVVELLLQSSGLEWFDNIADKPLTDFRFDKQAATVYEDQSVAEAMSVLWKNRVCAVAVVQRQTEKIIGCIRTSDVYHLLDNDNIFNNRKTMTVDHFIHLETSTEESDPTIDHDHETKPSTFDSVDHDHETRPSTFNSEPSSDRDLDTPIDTTQWSPTNDLDGPNSSTQTLILRNKRLPRKDSPITHRTTDSLKQAMETLAFSKSNVGFLVNEASQVTGLLTLRDVIVEFAPPCMDSRITGGRFFEDALDQTGCDVKDGTLMGRARLNMELIKKEKDRNSAFQKRKRTLKKKVGELSTLCGVKAVFIIYGPKQTSQDHHHQPHTWPEDRVEVLDMINKYKAQSDEDRKKRTSTLSDFFKDRNNKAHAELLKLRKSNPQAKYPTWDERFNSLSEEQLINIVKFLENRIRYAKTELVKEKNNNYNAYQLQQQQRMLPMKRNMEYEGGSSHANKIFITSDPHNYNSRPSLKMPMPLQQYRPPLDPHTFQSNAYLGYTSNSTPATLESMMACYDPMSAGMSQSINNFNNWIRAPAMHYFADTMQSMPNSYNDEAMQLLMSQNYNVYPVMRSDGLTQTLASSSSSSYQKDESQDFCYF